MVAKHNKTLLKGHVNELENSLKRIAKRATRIKEIGDWDMEDLVRNQI